MPEIRIELPAETLDRVNAAVEKEGLKDPAEFIRGAIETHFQEVERERNRIDGLLLEGIDSGPPTPMKPEEWEELHRRVHERAGAKSKAV